MATPTAPAAVAAIPRHCTAGASGAATVLTLTDVARRLPRLQPPPAYRLSIDSGVEYKNVRRAFARPMAVRIGTWQRLLLSLRLRMVAAASAEEVMWPCERARIVALCPAARALATPAAAGGLRELRVQAGWSRRELARRAGIGVDAVRALEDGRGMVGNLERVCTVFGLQILLALPPWHATLEDLWREQSQRCLLAPARYPSRRPSQGRPAA